MNTTLGRAVELGASVYTISELFQISPAEAAQRGALPTLGSGDPDFLSDEQIMVHGALLSNLVATATSGKQPTADQLVNVFNTFRVLMEGGPSRINFDSAFNLMKKISMGTLFQRRCQRCRALILSRIASDVCPFGMSCRLA
jgi:hypothetical protein